jgi:hypothetical protein
MSRISFSFSPGFPRIAADDLEREAIAGHGNSCDAVSLRGWFCCRPADHADDHVAAAADVVDRWPNNATAEPVREGAATPSEKRGRTMLTVYAETKEEQDAVERALADLKARFPGVDHDAGWDLADEEG